MSAALRAARYQLVNPWLYLIAPWALLAVAFGINLVIAAAQSGGPDPTKGLGVIFVLAFATGVLSASRWLPFGLALACGRRAYYAGTVGLAIALDALQATVVTVLQRIERATSDWGVSMPFFDVAHVFTGAWYATWLTAFVLLLVLFVYGMWFGLVYRRWDAAGLLVFIGAQLVVALVFTLTVPWIHVFDNLSILGLTGVLAAVGVALIAGGYAIMRRVTA